MSLIYHLLLVLTPLGSGTMPVPVPLCPDVSEGLGHTHLLTNTVQRPDCPNEVLLVLVNIS